MPAASQWAHSTVCRETLTFMAAPRYPLDPHRSTRALVCLLECLYPAGQRVRQRRHPPERSAMRSIDIHAHLTPQCFWRATEGGGTWHGIKRERDARGGQVALVGGRPQPLPPRARWTPEERLADMDSLGVDVHVLSTYVGFYNYHLPVEVARATSAATNDEIAGMIRARPDRFAGLGTLPMQDVKA